MKYKNKELGFTLPELIAVLVVLTLLISIGAGVFIRVRNSVLEKKYNELVDYLTLKAEEYANETGILTVSVQDLIDVGLVIPDDNEFIYDPRSKEKMNCYIIKSEFEDGHYVATLDEDYLNEDGTCKEYVRTFDYQICQVKEDGCYSIGNGEWLTGDVVLGVHKGNDNESALLKGSNISFSWSSNIGINEEYKVNNTIMIDSKGTKKVVYTCTVRVNGEDENISQEISQTVWIDNEAPVIGKVEINDVKETAEILATDGNGSGIKGYAIINSNTECSSKEIDYVSSNVIALRQNGTYKACVIDNAGNVGASGEIFEVNNIN